MISLLSFALVLSLQVLDVSYSLTCWTCLIEHLFSHFRTCFPFFSSFLSRAIIFYHFFKSLFIICFIIVYHFCVYHLVFKILSKLIPTNLGVSWYALQKISIDNARIFDRFKPDPHTMSMGRKMFKKHFAKGHYITNSNIARWSANHSRWPCNCIVWSPKKWLMKCHAPGTLLPKILYSKGQTTSGCQHLPSVWINGCHRTCCVLVKLIDLWFQCSLSMATGENGLNSKTLVAKRQNMRSRSLQNKQLSDQAHPKKTKHTVDGWNPAPPRMMIIPLFIGFQPSQVVQDFSHQQYVYCIFFLLF